MHVQPFYRYGQDELHKDRSIIRSMTESSCLHYRLDDDGDDDHGYNSDDYDNDDYGKLLDAIKSFHLLFTP